MALVSGALQGQATRYRWGKCWGNSLATLAACNGAIELTNIARLQQHDIHSNSYYGDFYGKDWNNSSRLKNKRYNSKALSLALFMAIINIKND